MSAIANQISQDILKKFIPLNTLQSAHLADIWNDCAIEACAKGTVLFEQGDDAKEFIYLISGMISLYAGDMEMETIVTGSEAARFAIAHHIPRKVKAVTKSKARIVRIPTYKLDIQRPEDTEQTYLVDEVEDYSGDWMTTMLQSPVFQRLPAANLQKVMMQMEEVAFGPGEVVVKQGDEADFYYIIKSGDCELIRQAAEGARPVKLAELHSCDAFGEDALLSGNPRNVTVRMKGKGQMLRLSKANFISLVKEPVLQYVSFEEGQQKVNEGANWLDVRGSDIYEQGCIEGSMNIPFFSLRMKIAELRHDQLQVLVCEKGRTSEAAAFLLLKFGFNALVLKGGMEGVKKRIEVLKPEEAPAAPIKPEITIVEKDTAPTVGVDDLINKELLAEAQNKISELERLCAQSNEKLNTLELEKSNLQQQADEQAQLVAELQVSSQTYAEKLDAANASNSNDNAELQESLFSEKEKNISLSEALENKQIELNGVSQEVENTRLNLEAAKQELAEKTAQAAEKDASLAEKQLGFEQLKNQLSNAEREGAQLSQQLEQKELDLNQQIAELTANNGLLLAEKETNVKLTAELANKNLELDQVFQEAESSHAELITVQQDLKELSSKLSVKNEMLAANELALQRLKEELNSVKSHDVELKQGFEQQLIAINQQVHELTSQKQVLEKSVEDSSNKAKELAHLNVSLEKQIGELEKGSLVELSEKEQEVQALNARLLEVGNNLDNLEATKNEADSLLQAARNELEQVRAQGEGALEQYKAKAESNQNKLRQELNEKTKKLEATATSVSDLEERLSSLDGANKDSDVALQEKQAEIDVFKSQISDAELKLEQVQLDLDSAISDNDLLKQAAAEHLAAERAQSAKLQEKLNQSVDQLKNLLTEHEELKAQFGRAKLEADALKEKEQSSVIAMAEQVELSDKLQKDVEASSAQLESSKGDVLSLDRQLSEMRERADNAEASLNAVASGKETLESELTERLAQMESNLSEAVEGKNVAERQLNDAVDEKSALQQQLTGFESELSSRSEDNKQLKTELEFVRQQLDASKQNESAEQLKSYDLLQQVSVLEKELVATKDELSSIKEQLIFEREDNEGLRLKALDAESAFENASEQNKRLSEQLEKLSAGQQSEGALAEQKIQAILDKLTASEEEKGVLIGQLEELEGKLSSISSVAEKAETDLSELKHKSVSNDGELTAAQQQIEVLELSLKAAVEEKEQLIATSNKDSDEKFSQFTEQVLRSEEMANNLQLKVDELSVLRSEREKELASLEKQLEAINMEKEGLHQRAVEAERAVSKQSDSANANDRARIIELEKQLDDANSALMDLELMVETSAVKVDDAPSEDEKGELKAVQSELNLVREQTEKDIQAMYVKLENSEKMNLALKRKVLSMQALVNQEVTPEPPPQDKKKGWWKK